MKWDPMMIIVVKWSKSEELQKN